MENIKNHPAPNFHPLMKLKADHFKSLMNWVKSYIADVYQIHCKFGLTGLQEFNDKSFKLNLNGDTLSLLNFKGIFPNGLLITLTENLTPVIKQSISIEEDGIYDILLIIDIDKFIFYGDIENEGNQLRQPYYMNKARLEIVSHAEFNRYPYDSALKIGELLIEENKYSLNEKFIPPCVYIGAYPRLFSKHAEYLKNWKELLSYSIRIGRNNWAKRKNPIIESLCELNKGMGLFLNHKKIDFQRLSPKGTPESMVSLLKELINGIIWHMETVSNSQELFDCFSSHMKYLVGHKVQHYHDIKKLLQDIIDYEFNLLQVNDALEKIDTFWNCIIPIWRTISKIDDFIPTNTPGISIQD